MDWWMYLILAICACVLLTALLRVREDPYSDWFILMIFAGLATITCTLVVVIVPLSRNYGHRDCNRWGRNAGQTVKFVKYSNWSWDCLVKVNDNQWVTRDQFIGAELHK